MYWADLVTSEMTVCFRFTFSSFFSPFAILGFITFLRSDVAFVIYHVFPSCLKLFFYFSPLHSFIHISLHSAPVLRSLPFSPPFPPLSSASIIHGANIGQPGLVPVAAGVAAASSLHNSVPSPSPSCLQSPLSHVKNRFFLYSQTSHSPFSSKKNTQFTLGLKYHVIQ